jgi:alpha-L-fucosidase 2
MSTENAFRAPGGTVAQVSAGCTMDLALIRELFAHTVEAARLLGVDAGFAGKLAAARAKLAGYQVGKHGQLQEWSRDFEENEPAHRHMSHLYPLYPGDEFTRRRAAELTAAARVSLERRLAAGGAQTGWSRAWAIGLWARLEDGERAEESLHRLLEHSTGANLFDTHPAGKTSIFQIDGNFGATAAVAEMLLASHEDVVHFLPALPKAWGSGRYAGLRARGGVEVELTWEQGKARGATLRATREGEIRLRAPASQRVAAVRVAGKPVRLKRAADGTVSLAVRPGGRYQIVFS